MSDIMGAFNQAVGLTDDPAKDQKDAQQAALNWQQQMYNQTRADMAPWLKSGTANLATLNTAMSAGNMLDPNARFRDFSFNQETDPSYKWRLQQGIDAVKAGGAAMGNLGSGNLGVALTNYGQNAASQEYQNAFNRYQSELNDWMGQRAASFNMLAATSNPQAVEQMGNFSMNAGVNMGNTAQTGAMNTMAAQQMQANNLQGAMGSLSQLGQGIYSMYNQNQMNNQMAYYNPYQSQYWNSPTAGGNSFLDNSGGSNDYAVYTSDNNYGLGM